MMSKTYPLPVVDLFGNKTRRELVMHALTATDEYQPLGDIAEHVSFSLNRIREELSVKSNRGDGTSPLYLFGIYDVQNRDVQIPQYRPAESDVMDVLRTWDGYPLDELFDTSSRQQLVEFFLDQSDPTESYSMGAIERNSPLGRMGIRNNIDVLVEAGLVDDVDGTRATEYTLASESDIAAVLRDLNNALVETYRTRQNESS